MSRFPGADVVLVHAALRRAQPSPPSAWFSKEPP
jgi:hypothetical protein